jgi:hypothetical protein
MVSSPVPNISSVGTQKLLGTTALPRPAFRGPDSSSLLGDNHVGRSFRGGSSSSMHTTRSYATPRTLSCLDRIPEMLTSSSATSLFRSIPGAHPKSSRFPAPKLSATSPPHLTADDKENSQDASSDSYVTASERALTKSAYSAGSVNPSVSRNRRYRRRCSVRLSRRREAQLRRLVLHTTRYTFLNDKVNSSSSPHLHSPDPQRRNYSLPSTHSPDSN